MNERVDVAIVGAGIAGTSLAAELPSHLKVIVLEAEELPAYHATGRSAAIFSTIYGNTLVRALSRASFPIFDSPPDAFAETPLSSPRGVLFVARDDQRDILASFADEVAGHGEIVLLNHDDVCATSSLLDPAYVARGLYEPGARDLDVHGLHQAYLRKARRLGRRVVTNASVAHAEHGSDGWTLSTSQGNFTAAIVVNAAGAWADGFAALAGARQCGITPLRRSALIAELGDSEIDPHGPMVVDVSEEFYFKPESGAVLISPADETPDVPHDVQPDEYDLAVAIARFEEAALPSVKRVRSRWAGLRSFASDKSPVVGYTDDTPDFFWLAGQGGYGIQTAPALARLAAALVLRDDVPADLTAAGVHAAAMSPDRAGLRP